MSTASPLGNGTEGRARWSLRLLGGFELGGLPGGERVVLPGKRERVLLACLALSPKGRQPRRKLVSLLWGDAADETTLDNLRNCLWNLRKALGDTEHRVVASDGEDIVLDVVAFDVDASAFRRLAAQSGRTELEAAVALYTGEFLDGLVIESEEFESWRRAEASRHRDQAIDVLTRLMTQFSECGETERAIEAGERILRLEPLHEAALRRLMRHYGESGRRGAAIQLYRTFADGLRTELDAQPEAETRAVFAEIARGGEEQTSAPAATDVSPPPASMARPTDASRGPLRPPMWRGFRLRAPLAIVAGALLVATALISYRQFTLVNTQPGVVAERAVAADPASTISIAVLPFLNLSGDANQEFFSDGMTEEITSALAMVPELKVVARTSAFQFKGEKNDMREVGQALNATHLVEGSVRKVGNRVRIIAQLIEARSGTHLWSENYDRELTDVFAIQDDIAQAIARALRVPLGLQQDDTLVSNRTIDPESYQHFLRAKSLVRARGLTRLTDGAALLEKVVARNPDYAPAWALLALAYHLRPNSSPERTAGPVEQFRDIVNSSLSRADAAARRAITLDPNLADGYVVLAHVQGVQGNILQSLQIVQSKALVLDPNNSEALHGYALGLAIVGHVKEAVAMRLKLLELEPAVFNFITRAAVVLWLDGQNDAAIAMLKDLAPERNHTLAMIYASMGRYEEAIHVLENLPSGNYPRETVKEAVRLLRTAPAKAASPRTLPALGNLSFVYLHVGAPDRALEIYDRGIEGGYMAGAGYPESLWHPSYSALRKTERFKAYARKAGLVDYWRARGWPEFCRPMVDDDFVCV